MSKNHTPTNLIELIDKLADHRILCVGDVMLDRFIHGQVERISPEAPIPVLRISREDVTLGGAGNVVRSLVALGGRADLVGVIGKDQAGYDLSNHLTSIPNVSSYLLTDPSRPTTVKTRYVADGQQMLRADHEISKSVSDEIAQQILLRVRGTLDDCNIIILSDYAKGVLSPFVVKEIIRLALEKNKKVLIDPKGRDFARYDGAYILTPNRKELMEVSGTTINNVKDAENVSRTLIEKHNLQGILAKLGSEGVCIVMRNEPAQHFHTLAREVFDVSGAGDTVLATLSLGLAGGLSPAESAALANIAGSIVVGKTGTASVTREELAQELHRNQSRQQEHKISSLQETAKLAAQWRERKLRVGFTNGCFDLLHPGHISLLRQARAACDKLIVGLNSDSSVRKLKGDNRPVQSENARAAVLASLADVDHVVIFSEDVPLNVIRAVKPDVLVKGADYSLDQVVGGDLVTSWGGKVILADLIDGQSTTATIAKLQSSQKSGGAKG